MSSGMGVEAAINTPIQPYLLSNFVAVAFSFGVIPEDNFSSIVASIKDCHFFSDSSYGTEQHYESGIKILVKSCGHEHRDVWNMNENYNAGYKAK
ncbi:MAG TPA: hypothetical protein VKA91_00825 [Nitrososphaeraceae archaeon]|nr:hypothetical protein [Nitrososphaeraceae archaeon]